jgi:hypothetical protein
MPITVSVIQLGDVVDDGAEARRLFGQGGLLAVLVGLGDGLSLRDDAGERLVQARTFDFFEYPVAVGISFSLGLSYRLLAPGCSEARCFVGPVT